MPNSQEKPHQKEQNEKTTQLEPAQRILDNPENGFLTTNHGVPLANNQDQLKAGERGPTLMEDFIYRVRQWAKACNCCKNLISPTLSGLNSKAMEKSWPVQAW